MLTRQDVVDKIEVLENGCIQVRTVIRILDGGNMISQSFHRHVIVPGQDYGNEDARVRAVCASTHTADCISAYEAAIAQQEG